MVIASSFIFFNFIIAEVTESYYTVKKDIKALIYKERAGLLAEAEDMMRQTVRDSNKLYFPKYLIKRSIE